MLRQNALSDVDIAMYLNGMGFVVTDDDLEEVITNPDEIRAHATIGIMWVNPHRTGFISWLFGNPRIKLGALTVNTGTDHPGYWVFNIEAAASRYRDVVENMLFGLESFFQIDIDVRPSAVPH